jgi:phosphate/sulfate permease
VPAQGASAELVAAGLIGFAGFSGYPVSTTHVVTGGIAGTMVASGAGGPGRNCLADCRRMAFDAPRNHHDFRRILLSAIVIATN